MANEKRITGRWPIEATAQLMARGIVYNTNILNVNLGGCFLDGIFPTEVGEVIVIGSVYNAQINGLQAKVMWIVNEPNLNGIGVAFEPMNDTQKFDLIKWFNQIVPDPRARP